MKTIVTFYSRSGENYSNGGIKDLKVGNAKLISEEIARQIGCNTYEITSKRHYSDKYKDCIAEAKEDLEKGLRPFITSSPIDLHAYDTVFIVYPNWWGDMPVAVMSFLEGQDLSRKTLIPVCTHEGSGLGKSVSTLKALQPKAVIAHQKAIRGSDAPNCRDDIREWLKAFWEAENA